MPFLGDASTGGLLIGALDADGPLSLARSPSRSFRPRSLLNAPRPRLPWRSVPSPDRDRILKFPPAGAERAASQGCGAQGSRFHTDGADARPCRAARKSCGFEVGARQMGRSAVLTIPLLFHSAPVPTA